MIGHTFALMLLSAPCASSFALHARTLAASRSPQMAAKSSPRFATTAMTAMAEFDNVAVTAPEASTSATKSKRFVTVARTITTFAATSLLLPAVALASGSAGEHLHLGQKVALFFQGFGLPDWLTLVLISATPAIELRGGVPVGNWMGYSPALTFAICVIGNMLPIAPMLLALRSAFFKKLFAPLLKRAEKKLAGLPTGQSRTLALTLFVGVPAPGTGAWTGAIIAYLLDMPFGTAMASILAGVLLAGAIMTTLTLAGKAGALAALAVLVVGGVGAILNAGKSEEGGDAPAAA